MNNGVIVKAARRDHYDGKLVNKMADVVDGYLDDDCCAVQKNCPFRIQFFVVLVELENVGGVCLLLQVEITLLERLKQNGKNSVQFFFNFSTFPIFKRTRKLIFREKACFQW